MITVYIHELENWPNLTWNAAKLADLLAHVRHHQGRLLGRMDSLGFLRNQAAFNTLTQDVLKTSEIEGEILNPDQVRSSLARHLGIDIGALTPADRHVDGIVETVLDATRRFAAPLTAARLFQWHAVLFPTGHSGFAQIIVGGWRDDRFGPMRVLSGPIGRERIHFEAPAARRLEAEMHAFLQWFNEPTGDDVLKAGVAHLWFVTIHPFADGNGRIARALADLLLARSENSPQRFYSMSAQIREERNAYYDALESAQKGSLDITVWLQWFLGCLDRAFDRADIILADVLRRARFWELHTGETFNPRQRNVLNRLLGDFEGKLTTTKWSRLAKCSPDTALRDIDDLLRRRILQKDAAGGRSTSYSLAQVQRPPDHS